MVNKRVERRTLKKRKRKKWILITALLLVLGVVTYTTYEYIAGKEAAEDQVGKSETNSKYEDEFQGVDDDLGKTNVLLLGVDSRGEENSRTDTIMIGQYDPDKETAKLVSIMRDSYVNIPGHGYNKINHAFFLGGPELLRQTIQQNFGINVEYYAIIDFNGFTQVVDTVAPEGVEIEVEKYMSHNIDVELQPGVQRLNGKELLGYARFRHDRDGDFARVERQQKVIKLLKDEMISFAGLFKLPRVVGTLEPYIDTNMKTGTILSLGKDFLLNPVDNIETLRIPIRETAWDSTYSHAGDVLEFNEAENRAEIKSFLNVE
ncbi:LCP family protein [Salinibacillus xinjiangensis]|uniref:Regulatory protein MsrR n=1 Tax=Salinibacillus xinjiangensis TaxID=1229268 RepID=A0A6G1X811_9BACI|nr:LCP family protein [Salinibacillus xinjiangensis]MRG87069.1 LytR family transcriptional regulator [Salinibacillus xinjiangensis]